jgi:predicted nucleic acid-binding protein
MATYLLDTSVIIDALNNKHGRNNLLHRLVNGGNSLACCPINITEVYAGMRPKEADATQIFLQSLEILPITWAVAKLAGQLKREYGQKGKPISVTDAIIAATALDNSLTLLTDNTKDFPMNDLSLFNLPRHQNENGP